MFSYNPPKGTSVEWFLGFVDQPEHFVEHAGVLSDNCSRDREQVDVVLNERINGPDMALRRVRQDH